MESENPSSSDGEQCEYSFLTDSEYDQLITDNEYNHLTDNEYDRLLLTDNEYQRY